MRYLLGLILLAAIQTAALAQNSGTVPNHAVPIGKGPGVSGFGSAAPGSAGQILSSNGTGSDPSFKSGSSWFDAAYCNTVGYLIVRTTGAWTCSKATEANPVWWGADPTGAADSSAAVTLALAASKNIKFPIGTFKLLSPIAYTFSGGVRSLRITGSGVESTILLWPSSNGIQVIYNGINQVVSVSDITLASGSTGSFNGIDLTHTTCLTGGTLYPNSIRNVEIRGDGGGNYWANGINVLGVSYINYDVVSVLGSGLHGIGFTIAGNPATCGTSAGYSIWHNITKPAFYLVNAALVIGEYTQGIMMQNHNIINSNIGVYVPPGLAGTLAQMDVSHGDIEVNQTSFSIHSNYQDFFVHNNVMISLANQIAVEMDGGLIQGVVSGNAITCDDPTTSVGVEVDVASHINILANTFFGCGAAINLGSGSSNIRVDANNYNSNTINVADGGTSNKVWDSPALNQTTAVTVGASPWTYTAGSHPETVYVRGGTVVAITVGGQSVAGGGAVASPATVQLWPGETMIVTYSSLPAVIKHVH